MNLVEIKDLRKSYQSGTETFSILKGLELQLEEGKSLAITGESGSGKSTLLNLVSGLDRADGGSIQVGSYCITGLKDEDLPYYRNQGVGFIFQLHYLLKDFTALENVMMPALMAGKKEEEIRESAAMLLEKMGLENRMAHYPLQLSGGERQRVAVARSLINDPPLILADEPTGNLDSHNSRRVEDLIFKTVQELGKTLILVTHDHGLAKRADRSMELAEGVLN